MTNHWSSRSRHWVAVAGLLGLLAGCGGGGGSDAAAPVVPAPPTTPVTPEPPITPQPPVTPVPGVATVSVSHDGQASTPPTRVTATFTAKVTSILPGLITVSGSCTNPPAPTTALDAAGLMLTVTLGNFQCAPGQTLTVSVDPTKVQLENATLADTTVWTRTFTMAMLPQQIGGNISGLAGRLVLQNNGGETLTSLGDGSFFFTTPIAYGAPYAVSVATQPQGQTCSVSNGAGTVGSVAIRNVAVVCSTNTYQVAGSVSGLVGNLTLQLNGGSSRTLSSNGAFSFPVNLAQGSAYAVTVQTQPSGQTCSVSNGTGAVNGPVSNVQVLCSANGYTVGGTVSGLMGSVALQNNGTDTLTTSSSGAFTFSTSVATGAPYNVTVLTQPAAQTCTVTNGSATIGATNVTNVGAACVTNTATITVSPSVLIVPGGGAGDFTITNTSLTNSAVDPDRFIPSLPSGWQNTRASNCATVLLPGASCNVFFYGASSDGTRVYVADNAVEFKGINTNTVNVTVGFSLSGRLVYGIKSPMVAMVASDIDGSYHRWSNINVATNATSATDGAANTTAILSADGSNNAAQYCRSQTAGNVQWSLPARCELLDCGAPNIKTNIFDKGLRPYPSSLYIWSSLEYDSNLGVAIFVSGGVDSPMPKGTALPAMCVAEHLY